MTEADAEAGDLQNKFGAPQGRRARDGLPKAADLGTHMEYTVSTPVGERFVVDRAVTRPAPAWAPIGVAFEEHGVTVVPQAQAGG